jgi:N-acetylmuramoyl-L-alanine amidase
MRLSALLAASMLLLAISVDALAASEVRSVRLWRAPDNTRLVFDLSGPVQHNLFILTAPDRIVVDIKGAQLATKLEQLSLANTPITSMRSAQRSPDELRLVIDLSTAVTPKSFTLSPNQQYGDRLVLDLFDQDEGAAPVTAAPVAAVAPTQTPVVEPLPVTQITLPRPLPPTVTSSGRRDVVIAIDAGHGGEDPGASGPGGAREKYVVLAIAKELQRQLNAEKGFRAELTRTGDYFIPLRRRTEIARKKGADLFVSIHADAAPRSSAFGASVYALSDRGATSETARWLANSENQSDLIGGAGSVSLDDKDRMLAGVLLDLSMTASLSSSLNVGQKVLVNMGRVTPLHKKRVEQAGFMVLKSPDIPSILVETGFISNPKESGKLATQSHQQALARSITSGVRQFFQQNPPPGTYLAWQRDSGKTPQGPREHVVSSGESLSLIAMRYQVTLASLRSANRMSNDTVKVGQVLNIPGATLAAQP